MKRTLTAAVVASILVVTGCRSEAPDASETAPAGWPDGFEDFSIVWTGERGIDLSTGPAVVVRAYIESFLLADLAGDDGYFYPGFVDAVGEEWRPQVASPAPQPWVGTMTNHLLSLKQSGSDVTAIGCMYTYGAASPHGKDDQGQEEYEAQAIPPGAPEAGITAFKVSLTAPSEYTGPEDAQEGPARTPFDDVFGGYKVTGYDGGYFGAEGADPLWPEYQQSTNECIAKAPDPLERRKFLSTNYPARSDFPTLRPNPGWPARPAS